MTGSDFLLQAMRTDDGNSSLRLEHLLQLCKSHDLQSSNTELSVDLGGVLNACLGMAGEVGETVDIIKKWIFHEKALDREHLKREIGDVLWYIADICYSFNFDLDEVMQMNIDKHWKRYPNGFNVYDANHRSSDDT